MPVSLYWGICIHSYVYLGVFTVYTDIYQGHSVYTSISAFCVCIFVSDFLRMQAVQGGEDP